MSVLTFHSFRGEKSALVYIQDDFSFELTWLYVPKRAFGDSPIKGETTRDVDMSQYDIVPIVDLDTGEVRKAKDGSVLKTLSRK